jgi:hypothetical protein
MPVQPARVVRQALLNKGMTPRQGDHEFFHKTIPGVYKLVTKISHGGGEIDDSNGSLMATQLCLHLREFWRLIDCSLSEQDWERIVRQRCANGHNPLLRRGY